MLAENSSGNVDRDKFAEPLAVENVSHEVDKFEVFEKWLLENGAKFPKLQLKNYGEEVRGCIAVEHIEEEEIIIEIPLKCLITVEMGKDTDVGRAILSSNIELDAPKHIFLMLYMLIDRKNSSSFFKPYYDILPPTLKNMPIFWDENELKYLEGSYLLYQIDERKLAIENDYIAICSIAPEFEIIATLEEFSWARMCVCSRNFGLTVNGLRTAALVPYADMLNHYRPRETKWQYDDLRDGFTIVSLQSIGPNAQVYDSYGQKCNHRFLLNYGFSVENNMEVPILFQLMRDDPLYERKCTFWSRDGSLPVRRLRISISDNDCLKIGLAMIRIIVADDEDFEQIISSFGGPYRAVRDLQLALNLRNEVRAMQFLTALCDDYLSRYPTSIAQDTERLAAPDLTPFSNEKHALIQIRGEKEILIFYKRFSQSVLRLLSLRLNATTEFETLLTTYSTEEHILTYQYCRNVAPRLRYDEQRRIELMQKNVDMSKPTVV
eukprot:gene3490-6947_t